DGQRRPRLGGRPARVDLPGRGGAAAARSAQGRATARREPRLWRPAATEAQAMSTNAASATLAVIGGSGIYQVQGLSGLREHRVQTPYGVPSDVIVEGTLGETRLLFLPRHGRGHPLPPHAVNYRANVCALKRLGATHLLSLSAVGSMKE